jgi:hypothetical protein
MLDSLISDIYWPVTAIEKKKNPLIGEKFPILYAFIEIHALAVCLRFSDSMTSLLRSSSRKGEVLYQELSVCMNRKNIHYIILKVEIQEVSRDVIISYRN